MCHTFLTEEMIQELKKENACIALIDADIPSYSVGFSCATEASWGLVESTMNHWMYDKMRAVGATHYISFLTDGGKNFRLTDASTREYKGNRAGSERPKWYLKLREHLEGRWKSQAMKGIEADDALTIAQTYFRSLGIKSVICSLDKDLLQCPGDHYNWNTKEIRFIDESDGEYRLWKQVITGDLGTDNIPGLSEASWKPKVGTKVPVFETYLKVPTEPKVLSSGKLSTRKLAHARFSHWESLDDPKQCKGLKDFEYGPEKAKEILKGVPVELMPAAVLNEYVDAYYIDGMVEGYEDPCEKGIERFNEVFNLIYMLRDTSEIPNDASIDFTPIPVDDAVLNEFDVVSVDASVLDEFDDDF